MPDQWRTTRTPQCACPFCDHPLSAATDPGGSAAPKPGSLSVCISCAQALIFDDRLMPRRPAAGELEAIYAEHPAVAATVRRFQRAVRRIDRRGAAAQQHS